MPLPLLSARRAVVCFCVGLVLAISSKVSAQTNYYAATGTEYAIAGSLPGDQVFPDIALNTNGGFLVWQDNITDPVGEGISAEQINSTLSGSGDVFAVNVATTNDQQNARVALLKKGGAAFVWQGGPKNKQHIFARFLNASNLWANTTNVCVSTYNSGSQANPAVATLTNGNVIVVWNSFNQVSTNSMMDVYGQILSTNGTAIGTNFLINQFTSYNQRNPTVAALTNGGFVVAWISEQERVIGVTNQPGTSVTTLVTPSVDVYARLYTNSASGAAASGSEFLVNADGNPCARPAAASAADGSYMIAWCAQDLADITNGWDIYERSFTNSSGGQVNLVNTHTYGDQYAPRITVIGKEYLIVWTSLGQDGSREGVYGQFIHEGDSPVNGEFRVNTTTLGQQMQPVVASDGYANFLAVWTSFTLTPTTFDLFAQRYENTQALNLLPMPAPFVCVPFVISNGIYQPELVVSWAQVQGLAISNYLLTVDGTNTVSLPPNQWVWTMGPGTGLTTKSTNSTHSFAIQYQIVAGFTGPISPTTSAETWSGLNWGGIPYEWMAEWFGGYYGGTYHTNAWQLSSWSPNAGGPTLLQIFMTGGNPYDPTTWLQSGITRTAKGIYFSWTTQPGMTYQVQEMTSIAPFSGWVNYGAPRFASGTNDTIYAGNGPAGYFRVQLLWQ